MTKKETANKKVKRIYDTLDRIERGMYVGVTMCSITDEISWLWQYRLIDRAEMEKLTDRATNVINAFGKYY